MVQSETEKFVARAEIMFTSQKKRLSYVNRELGCRILPDLTVDSRDKGRSISIAKYYRVLGTIAKKTRERMSQVSINFERTLVRYLEELYLIIDLKWENYWTFMADNKIFEANKILNEIVAIQPYIVNQEEAIKLTMEDEYRTIEKTNQTPPDSIFEN